VGLVSISPQGYGDALLNSLLHAARSWHANVNPETRDLGIEWQALILMVRILWPSRADDFTRLCYKDALLYTYQLAGLTAPIILAEANDLIEIPEVDDHVARLLRAIADVLNRNPTEYFGD
jgi:hypothetical protein